MFFQRIDKPRQQKFLQSAFTATLFLTAGLTAIAKESVTKEQIDDNLSEAVMLGEASVENTTTRPMSKENVGNAPPL